MRKLKSFLILITVQALIVGILLEVGFRIWLSFTQENFETFENKIKINNNLGTPKQKITGSVTLGKLIQKSAQADRVYEFMPNLEATYLGQPFRTNSYGMREEEYTPQKDPLTRRIIGIGDSVMFGWGVNEQDRYLNLIREKLSSIDNFNYETLNFGTPGYNTTMEVSTYESLASKFDPDLVILHFVENDHGIPEFMNLPLDLYSLRKSFVFETLNNAFTKFYTKQNTVTDFVGVEFPGFDHQSKKNVIKQYQHMLGSVGFGRALEKLGALVCPKKIPVIILTGRLRSKFKKSIESNAKYWGFQIVEAAPVVNQYFEKIGISNDIKKRRNLLWLNEHDPHPSELGHQLYAEALFPKVIEILNNETGEFEPHCEHEEKKTQDTSKMN